MGIFSRRTRAPSEESPSGARPGQGAEPPRDPGSPPLPVLTKRSSAHDVAHVLFARYGGDVDTDVLFDVSSGCDLDPKDVDDALWQIRADAAVKVEQLDLASLSIMNLRTVESMGHRVVGVGNWLTDGERRKFGGTVYLLVREPDNEFDPNAVAVFWKDRKVGYTSAARAAILAPLLDALPADGFRVSGDSQFTVNVPKPAALRKLVQ